MLLQAGVMVCIDTAGTVEKKKKKMKKQPMLDLFNPVAPGCLIKTVCCQPLERGTRNTHSPSISQKPFHLPTMQQQQLVSVVPQTLWMHHHSHNNHNYNNNYDNYNNSHVSAMPNTTLKSI